MDSFTSENSLTSASDIMIVDEVEVPVIRSPEIINVEDPLPDVRAEEIEINEEDYVGMPILVPKTELNLYGCPTMPDLESDGSSALLDDCAEPSFVEEIEINEEDYVGMPILVPKTELNLYGCPTMPDLESDGSSALLDDCAEPSFVEDDGIIHDLVPIIKTETPSTSRPTTRELRVSLKRLSAADLAVIVKPPRAVERMETVNKDSEGIQGSDLLCSGKTSAANSNLTTRLRLENERLKREVSERLPSAASDIVVPSNPDLDSLEDTILNSNEYTEVGERRRRQVGYHRKRKMLADTNNSSSTSNVFTKTTYTCEKCNISFNCQVRYKKHLLNHSESELLSCAHCSYKTLCKEKLISHMNQHVGEVKKQYTCKVCSYKCSRSGHLTSHMHTHTGEKPYSCNVCSYKCSQSSDIAKHMRTHTGEKPYSCNVCSYKCSQSNALKSHMRTHTGEKPYSCNVCSYKCSQSGHLTKHMRTHTGEKPYSCNVCSYKVSRSDTLTSHMRTHTGEKLYSCNVCSYKCSKSGNLTTHMRTHTGEKPYSCNVCSYKFSRSDALTSHMRTHTGEKL